MYIAVEIILVVLFVLILIVNAPVSKEFLFELQRVSKLSILVLYFSETRRLEISFDATILFIIIFSQCLNNEIIELFDWNRAIFLCGYWTRNNKRLFVSIVSFLVISTNVYLLIFGSVTEKF
jgi:hypothetical protein